MVFKGNFLQQVFHSESKRENTASMGRLPLPYLVGMRGGGMAKGGGETCPKGDGLNVYVS